MRPAFIIIWLCMNGVFQTGQLAVIETEETVWAAVGGQASLSCQLTGDKEVLLITWQKILSDGETNLATYTKKFGSRVRPGLQEMMDIHCEDLQSCSMVIRKVTEQDEGCYQCLFNTYPLGALIGRTCLRLYELHGPVLDVSRSSSPAGSVVSCSATGRPAPTVTLTAPQQNLSLSLYNNTSRVTNSNGTVTVTTTALLSASSSTQVGCSVSVLSAAPRELLITVPGSSHTSDHGLEEDSGSDHRELGWRVGVALGLLSGASFLALFFISWYMKRHLNRKLQKEEKPEEQTEDPQSEEQMMPTQETKETTSVLINRQSSKQSLPSPTSPMTSTTPDIESFGSAGINLHKKLKAKKSV